MSDKRKAFEAIVAKLEKLLPHLGDENTNEAGVALQRINSLLHAAKLDWHDLLALMSEQKEGSVFSDLLRRLSEKDADVLVRLGRAGATFFCSAAGEAFADVAIGRSRITWPLSSSEFSEWLLYQFYIDADRRKAPAAAAVNSAVRTLRAHARFEGGRHEVHLRTAAVGDKIYVDVGDAEWHVIEISPNDWRVVKDAPVRFRRTTGMAALPLPQRGGSINRLRPFVNFTGADFVIYVSALVDALRPGAPHPVIYFAGDEGSTKSTAEKIMLSLVDPSDFPLRTLPGTVRELFVNANGAQMLAFDNVSSISPAISDALCQIATGSGIAMRKLFTDSDLVLIGGSRTVVLSGLLNVISRSDLADRAVIMLLPVLVPENRRAEAEFWRAFNAERPAIFGALLDIVAYGLSRLPQTRLQRLPRMADFAVWAMIPSDQKRRIDFIYWLEPDCTTPELPVLRIVEQPRNGKVTVERSTGFTNFPQNNPRHECNRSKSDGVSLVFEPTPRFVGIESITVEILLPSGHAVKRHYTIEVKAVENVSSVPNPTSAN